MSHAPRSWLDPFPLPHSSPSLFYPPNRSISCILQQGVQFGRLAEQSPLASYEPNDPVDVSSTGLTTMLLPLRKASIGSTYNSGEDIATSPSSSEVDERPNLGMLASNTEERDSSAAPFRIYHSNRENSESRSSHVPTSTGRPVTIYSPKNKSSRDSNVLQESSSEKQRVSLLSIEKSAMSLKCEQIMPPREKKQLHQDSLKRNLIRHCFLRYERLMCCLMHDPSRKSKN